MSATTPISRERIEIRLRPLGTKFARASDDHRRHSDYDLNAAPDATAALRPAAVMVPLVDHGHGYTVLLTQRTDHLHHHAGQVSFPGGRLEAGDDGPLGAALRETEEEIGLSPSFVKPLGMLDDYETVTGFLVTPVVGIVTPGFELRLDAFEVADAFEVPLDFILDARNHQIHSRLRGGQRRRYFVFEYADRYIWGATAGMLMNLYRRLHGLSAPMRPPPTDAQ